MDKIKTLKLALKGVAIPEKSVVVGWINKHPSGRDDSAFAVLRQSTGVEVAWDGRRTKSLPKNWRDKVEYEDASDLTQVMTKQPKSLKATIESALSEGENLSEFVRLACANELLSRGVTVDLPEIKWGRPVGDNSQS